MIDYHPNYGKINILNIAKKYFRIPNSEFSIGLKNSKEFPNNIVVKSLSSAQSADNKVMMSTLEDSIDSLDPNFPWFIQDEIKSRWDVTVFTCNSKFFAFKRDRKNLEGIDWRTEQEFFYEKQEWFPYELTEDDTVNLKKLSKDLNIEFGRFDFMTKNNSKDLVFLEFNATGQWVFLDIENKYGLLEEVTKWLKS